MTIEVRCPEGHKLSVPDKAAGKAVKCPKCQSVCKVPLPQIEPVEEDDQILEDSMDHFDEEPLPTSRGKKRKKESTSEKEPSSDSSKWIYLGGGLLGGSMITALLMYLVLGGKPDAGLEGAAPSEKDRPSEVASVPATPAPQTPAASSEPPRPSEPPSPSGPPGTPRDEVIRALFNASDMVEKKQYRMLAHEFAPMLDRLISEGKTELPPDMTEVLSAHFSAARKGEIVFNPDSTYAEIVYVLRPTELLQNEVPDFVIPADQPLTPPAPGLGGDLSKMLLSASELLKNGKYEEFVLNVYPEGEIDRLQKTDTLKALLYRLKTVPQMVSAMNRDLQLAATKVKTAKTSDLSTVITVESPSSKDPRVMKFEKVEGNWRFADVNRATREAVAKYSSTPNPPSTVPGERGSMVLQKIDGRWKLAGELSLQPMESSEQEAR